MTDNEIFLYDFVMRSKELEKTNPELQNKLLNYVCSKKAKLNNDNPIIEAIVIQSVILTQVPLLRVQYRREYQSGLMQRLYTLSFDKKYGNRKTKFACGFIDIFLK